MAKWLMFHLENMRGGGEWAQNNQLYKDLYKSHNVIEEDWNIFRSDSMPVSAVYNYGLGWFSGAQDGYRSAYHYGWLLDFYSRLLLFPTKNFAIFVSINGNGKGQRNRHLFNIHCFISDLLLGETPWLNSTNVCSSKTTSGRTRATSETDSKISLQPVFYSIPNYDELEGNYGNALYANLTILYEWRARQLRLKYGNYVDLILAETTVKDRFSIAPVEPISMLLCVYDDYLVFGRDKSAKIDSLEIPCFDDGVEIKFYKNFVLTDTHPGDEVILDQQPRICQVSSESHRFETRNYFTIMLFVVYRFLI
ncbi:uncharacterized protein LOC141913361 [Tubulanus polymorphus]|uniref:uncharacterized protein LOC141913361 n=1 Tax=Tubulanus polymorphus TaxID=672921 RepID=UPI003DA401DA